MIAAGKHFSVRQFIKWSAQAPGSTLRSGWQGIDEIAVEKKIEGNKAPALRLEQAIVRINLRFSRPAEVETLQGDASRARSKLGWAPDFTAR